MLHTDPLYINSLPIQASTNTLLRSPFRLLPSVQAQ